MFVTQCAQNHIRTSLLFSKRLGFTAASTEAWSRGTARREGSRQRQCWDLSPNPGTQ